MILEAKDVIKQYKQSDAVVTAVNRASITIEQGEFVAVVGTSGSGKSTFLHLCAGLLRPNYGSIKIRGNDITQMKPDEVARLRGEFIGVVFQKHNLIPQLTARENILVPAMICERPDYTYEQSFERLVDALMLRDRLDHLPSELSGGKQQRVAIARALMNRPQILLADEPTGNLDRENADEVLRLLLDFRDKYGQTMMMVTHDESIAKKADRVLTMVNGELK
jgi:putative ABC transport system ATP-binding protein